MKIPLAMTTKTIIKPSSSQHLFSKFKALRVSDFADNMQRLVVLAKEFSCEEFVAIYVEPTV